MTQDRIEDRGQKETRAARSPRYIHALRFRFLTPLYDMVVGYGMREEMIKRSLIHQSSISTGMRVLDLGCGTGTLAVLGCSLHPLTQFTGLDGDPVILDIARRKAASVGAPIRFVHGFADDLPFSDGEFDRVVSSLLFHHLTTLQKQRSFTEIRRVLSREGELHIADFGKPEGRYARVASAVLARFDGIENTRDNFEGRLPALLEASGFAVQERKRIATAFGTLQCLAATRR